MTKSIAIYPLGVGTSGAKVFWHTCFILLVDDRRFLIDCPRNFFEMLAFNDEHGDLPVVLEDCRDILLTHLHFDHAEGLVEIAHSTDLASHQRLNLYAPSRTLGYLWSQSVERGIVSAAQVEGGSAALDRPHDFEDFVSVTNYSPPLIEQKRWYRNP